MSPQDGVVPSERNPVRTKAVFDLMEHRFSFCRDFVLTGFRSIGTVDCILIGRLVSFWVSTRYTETHAFTHVVYLVSIIYVM